MRQYIDIITEAAQISDGKQQVTRLVSERLQQDSKTMSIEDIVKAIVEAFKRIKSMSEKERHEVVQSQLGIDMSDDNQGAVPMVSEQHLKEFLGWDDVIVTWSAIIIFSLWAKVPPMAFVEIVARAALVLLSIPYIVVMKIFNTLGLNRFTFAGYLDDLMGPVVRKYP